MKNNPSHYLNIERDRHSNPPYKWRVRARSGKIVAVAGEGYGTIGACMKGFDGLCRGIISGRLDTRDYHIGSYEDNMATRTMSPDDYVRMEKENEQLKAKNAQLQDLLRQARGEKPAPKPVTEEIVEEPTKGKKGE